MAKQKVNMPTSGAGLTRYFDDYKSNIEFEPGLVIVFAIIVIVVMLVLHMFGWSLLGITRAGI